MRIITGKLKGRRINLPKKLDLRPTTDRTKESIFGVIDSHKEIREAIVLDLYAGSGNLGFEAISRGAKHVTFVESNAEIVRHIGKTAALFDVESQVSTINQPAEQFIQGRPQAFNLIFADPPYDVPLLNELIEQVVKNGWLEENGWFILEHDKRHNFADHPHCRSSKAYGRTIVAIFDANPVSSK